MRPEFSPEQRAAVQELVGLAPRLSRWSRARRPRVALAEVRQALALPEPRHLALVGPRRWLAGGAVLRWLCRGLGRDSEQPGDFDLFFPSLAELHDSALAMLADGFSFRCYRSRQLICQLCGRPGQFVEEGSVLTPYLPLFRVRCQDCGEFGGVDAASLPRERLLRLSQELVAGVGVMALELSSQAGDLFHLSAVTLRPGPAEVIARFDFSVAQFALDGEHLCCGPYAWTDLLLGRFRWCTVLNPRHSHGRIRKYVRLGFRPYLLTRLRFAYRRLRGFR